MNKLFITHVKLLAVMLIILLTVTSVKASDTNKMLAEAKKISQEAYLKFDKTLYLKSYGLCERVLSAEPNNKLALYLSAYNQYRLTNIAMVKKDTKLFDTYFESAIEKIKKLEDTDKYRSESKALLATIYMMKIAISPSDAPALSGKIHSYLGQSLGADSQNPRAYLTKGSMLFNTPPAFGGSIDGALNNFNKAISIYESDKNAGTEIDWGYLETLAWKGMALTKMKDTTNAILVYEKAIKIEPNFAWVKYRLLPSLNGSKGYSEDNTNKPTSNLKVIITNFENDDGFLMIALNNSKDSFLSDEVPFRSFKVKIIDKIAECSFENIPFGEYGINSFHDENDNNKLDKNIMGIPTESYGFSNNGRGMFGPPDYDDVKFAVNKEQITIQFKVN